MKKEGWLVMTIIKEYETTGPFNFNGITARVGSEDSGLIGTAPIYSSREKAEENHPNVSAIYKIEWDEGSKK